MNTKKTLASCAIALVLTGGMTTANALTVTSWTLTDFDGDGLKSDFNLNTMPPGNSGNTFGAGDELCNGSPCADILFDAGAQGVNTFTTGFNFGGGGDYQPVILSGGISATIDETLAASGDGQALQFSVLDWGGIYQGTATFSIPPDHLRNCTGEPAGVLSSTCGETSRDDNPLLNNPQGYNVQITDLNGGDYGIVVTFTSTYVGPGIIGVDYNKLRLEGIMHTVVPIPATAWLFTGGLLGLLPMVNARRRRVRKT